MAKEELTFEIIRSAKRFLQLDTAMLRDFINSFTEEGALLLYDRKTTLAQERKWQREKAREIGDGQTLFAVCWKGELFVGNCEARLGIFKESHNCSFGLVVRKGFRGMGIGEKLLSIAMNEAKRTLKAKNLWIDYIQGNAPARSLYEKLGFCEVARLKRYVRHKGAYRDKILMQYFGNR